jgi:hypothetical protein
MMTTPAAPADRAFSTLVWNVQVRDRERAKISVGQVFIFAMFNPEVVPTEEGRLITRA